MKAIKDMLDALDVDEKINDVLDFLTDKIYCQEIKNYKNFYKISGEIKDRKLYVKMYFDFENKWRDIAIYDLEKEIFENHIDKRLFKYLLDKEHEYIEKNVNKELQRSLNIILSLLALSIGVIFALIISYLFF
ncbi:MAG TPA: hypothetical protein EYP82_05965 [Hydrogenothermaceae bacterium]|nr:hypothetical protein [Hydrogenothermaceae bacterium]